MDYPKAESPTSFRFRAVERLEQFFHFAGSYSRSVIGNRNPDAFAPLAVVRTRLGDVNYNLGIGGRCVKCILKQIPEYMLQRRGIDYHLPCPVIAPLDEDSLVRIPLL